MLKGFNTAMKTMMPIIEGITNSIDKLFSKDGGFLHIAGVITVAAVMLVSAAKFINRAVLLFSGRQMFGTGMANRGLGAGGDMASRTAAQTATTQPLRGIAKQSYTAARTRQTLASGKSFMMKGAGVGMAGAGIGVGIGAAAVGIGQLAKAVKDVDVEKLKMMNWTLVILGASMAAFGLLGLAAAPGLYAVAVAGAAIGAGIGIAAVGIGYMAEGFSKLITSAQGGGDSLFKVAAGIVAVNLAMATGVAGVAGGLFGSIGLAATLSTISTFVKPITAIGNAFKEINLALTGNKEDYIAIESAISSISNMNIGKGSAITELVNLFKSPLTVQFSGNEITLRSNITLEIDGQTLMSKTLDGKAVIDKIRALQQGQAGK